MGFSYPAWSGGVFYPAGTKPGDYLAYYARCFDCVELDTTFYAAPDAARVRRWASQVPEGFRFSAKVPRDVTHADDVGDAAPLLVSFCDTLRDFGDKLGVVLLQFPPSFTASRWREFERVVTSVPQDVPLAAEFRHSSWWKSPGSMKLLDDHAVAWVSAEYVGSPTELRTTAARAYVRLIGEHDRYPAMNREEVDPTDRLVWWRQQLEASGVTEAWVLHNNDYAGFSIATAERFKTLIGQPVSRPPAVTAGLFG